MTTTKNKPAAKRSNADMAQTEQSYMQMFSPHPLPFQGLYTEEDSLEQPSQLTYVPSTTTPSVM